MAELITLGKSMGKAIARDDGDRIHISIGYLPSSSRLDQSVALLPEEMDRLVSWWKNRKKVRAK